MNQQSKTQLLQVASLGIAITLTGALVGYAFLFLSVFLFLYIARLLLHIGRLDEYVVTNDDKPQLLMGIIDTLYSRIYANRRKSARNLKQLNDQLARNEKWLNQLRDGVMVIDEYDHIIRLNKRCERLFKITQNQPLDFSVYSLIRTPKFTAYLTKKNYKQPLELKLNTIPPKWIEISVTAFPTERLLLLRDITETQLANQMKQDFIANLSHELRTPMTVLQGYTETLPLVVDNDKEQTAAIIGSMSAQVSHLNQLIEDLSDLVAIESAPIHSNNTIVDVPQLIAQQIEACKMVTSYEQQLFTTDLTPQIGIKGNPKEIMSVISNLIFNAVKYTKGDQQITISWKADEHKVRLTVEDQGIGIEEGHISRLTERFYRVDNSRTSTVSSSNESAEKLTSGTGLGLAIVKHVLLNHQAVLLIESKPKKGSKFTCEFPIERLVQLDVS